MADVSALPPYFLLQKILSPSKRLYMIHFEGCFKNEQPSDSDCKHCCSAEHNAACVATVLYE